MCVHPCEAGVNVAWAPDIPAPSNPTPVGWFGDVVEHAHIPTTGWFIVTYSVGDELGLGSDAARLRAGIVTADMCMGSDATSLRGRLAYVIDRSVGSDWSSAAARTVLRDGGIGSDVSRIRTVCRDTGIGSDLSRLRSRTSPSDSSVGVDASTYVRSRNGSVYDTVVGADAAIGRPRSVVSDSSAGSDYVRTAGLRGTEGTVGVDTSAYVRSRNGIVYDTVVGADTGRAEPRQAVREVTVGADYGTASFTDKPDVAQSLTANGTVTIPVWCRYIDAIAVGGGGGGNSGNNTGSAGNGGNGGVWAWRTYERGVDVPWTAASIAVAVGAGGGSRTNGTASTVTPSGVAAMSAAGGTWNDSRGGDRDGQPPSGGNSGLQSGIYRDVVLNGVTYSGGSWSNSDTANVPGAGGRGGGGSVFPLSPGSGKTGARGQVWLRFWR